MLLVDESAHLMTSQPGLRFTNVELCLVRKRCTVCPLDWLVATEKVFLASLLDDDSLVSVTFGYYRLKKTWSKFSPHHGTNWPYQSPRFGRSSEIFILPILFVGPTQTGTPQGSKACSTWCAHCSLIGHCERCSCPSS